MVVSDLFYPPSRAVHSPLHVIREGMAPGFELAHMIQGLRYAYRTANRLRLPIPIVLGSLSFSYLTRCPDRA